MYRLCARHVDDLCAHAGVQSVLSRLDLDEDGVVSWDELLERLKEVRDADPDRHAVRVEESHGKFMSTKVTSQQTSKHIIQPMLCVRIPTRQRS